MICYGLKKLSTHHSRTPSDILIHEAMQTSHKIHFNHIIHIFLFNSIILVLEGMKWHGIKEYIFFHVIFNLIRLNDFKYIIKNNMISVWM